MTESGTLGERRKRYNVSVQRGDRGFLLSESVGLGQTPGEKPTVEISIETFSDVEWIGGKAGPDYIEQTPSGWKIGSETAEPYRFQDKQRIKGPWRSMEIRNNDSTEPVAVFQYDKMITEIEAGESTQLIMLPLPRIISTKTPLWSIPLRVASAIRPW